jgi:hypothetical protein
MATEVWERCNLCNHVTRHRALFKETFKSDDQLDWGTVITWWDTYQLLQCMGCDTVQLKHEHSFSEECDETGKPRIQTVFYPSRISRSKPAWLGSIDGPFWMGDSEIEQLLEEIYVALHSNSLRLAALGIRALVEYIMIDKIGDNGSIGENITKFFDAGYVAPNDQTTFRDNVIEAGHAAMHRGYTPNPDDLRTLLDIAENLIAAIYIHPERAKKLGKRIPSRKPRKVAE